MRYTLRIEWRNMPNDISLSNTSKLESAYLKSIGHKAKKGDAYKSRRPWVAKIVGPHEHYTLDRHFQESKTDYSEANSKGSRGVHLVWHLDDGYYEYCENWERGYFTVHQGKRYNIELEDVRVWAENI